MGSISVELRVSADRILPVEKYAARFLENSPGQQVIPMAEAPPTPDCISESEVYEVPEEICSEVCSILYFLTCLSFLFGAHIL
jgi:hypothetical protein